MAGKRYALPELIQNNGDSQDKIEFSLEKAKALKKIEVKKAPDEQFIYRGVEYAYELNGLVLTAYYADGSSEEVRYGDPDASGRQIRPVQSDWVAEDTYRVIIALGTCRAFVDLKEAATEQLPLVKTGEKTELASLENSMVAFRYSPEESGYYSVDVENGYLQGITEEVSDTAVSWRGNYYLEAGKVYRMVIRRFERSRICNYAPWSVQLGENPVYSGILYTGRKYNRRVQGSQSQKNLSYTESVRT